MNTLDSTSAVIDALGGNEAVAALFNVGVKAVKHWRYNLFPPHTYIAIIQALAAKGLMADVALWDFTKAVAPAKEQRAAR